MCLCKATEAEINRARFTSSSDSLSLESFKKNEMGKKDKDFELRVIFIQGKKMWIFKGI